jgi:hypothetical protein
MKQTALQWFIEQLINEEGIDFIPTIFVRKAKKMEKEQIIKTFKDAQVLHAMDDQMRGEQYYKKIYEK